MIGGIWMPVIDLMENRWMDHIAESMQIQSRISVVARWEFIYLALRCKTDSIDSKRFVYSGFNNCLP